MLARPRGAGERLAAKGEAVPADEVIGVGALAGKRDGEHLLARLHGAGERLVAKGEAALAGEVGGVEALREGGALDGPATWGR